MDYVLITKRTLDHAWSKLMGGLLLMKADWAPADIYTKIADGQCAAYIAQSPYGDYQGFLIFRTLMEEFRHTPTLHVWIAHNADGTDVVDCEEFIRSTAKAAGCDRITFGSPRPGWAKRYNLIDATYEIPLEAS